MKHVLLATAAALALAVAPAAAQQKTVKIGFIGTFSGAAAALGNDMRNSFEIGLDHAGRKLGGLPVEVIYEDDQIKPEVGVQKTQKLIESDRVDFLVGYIWSNVLLASLKPATDSKTFLITTNAGPSQIAGELCSPYVFSTSWQNDQRPAAVGTYLTKKGFKTLFTDRAELRRRQGPGRRGRVELQRPGGRQGADPLAGPTRLLGGARQGQGGQARCRVRVLSGRGRHAVPDPVHPGRPERRDPALHVIGGRRSVAAAPEGPGAWRFGVSQWGYDMDNPTNKRYVADYKAKHKTYPSAVWRADLRCGRR